MTPRLTALLQLSLSGLVFALSGCSTPDPLFLQNSAYVGNTNYPRNQIVGTWANMIVNPVATDTIAMEHKLYLEIRPGGVGTVREVSLNVADGSHLAAEAPITWVYANHNLWHIHLPASTAYRVTESHDMRLNPNSYSPPNVVSLRYYAGNLYEFSEKKVFVPATRTAVSTLANRMRAETPVLRIQNSR